ncbi:MAG: type restriction enzyme subunit [Candidatus Cloacimonadota bacterium]|nr:type restriction enzyme subunit [Candidatus Cloacimonadota bacterium]MDK2851226.1 type restriction enzyme subunit [Candidatus Cloacimonadota bacterium]
MNKEASARIKINELLKEAGWRFFDEKGKKANIILENQTKITHKIIDELGNDFETSSKGFIDFLLLDEHSYPIIVLEAKSEKHNPLVGKEQARAYARSQNCRFILLSNGNLHYFWDTQQGNPYIITKFPSPESMKGYEHYNPDTDALVKEIITTGYIAITQKHDYDQNPDFHNEDTRSEYLKKHNLSLLRSYQVRAVESIQNAVRNGANRFLFEMATGTGKTLISAAVMKLFLKTGNAHRVLFLVDRLELEDQAQRNMVKYLKNDFTSVVYKEVKEDWRKAEIVISTVQSLLSGDKYRTQFSPTDFDLVISDEAHRSIGGNARAVFEYFVGYKLGLTATPKDYIKNAVPDGNSPRDYERRLLLDTYETFGCKSGIPTFRYSLGDGVKDGYLVSPTVIDARSQVTTQLLSDQGYTYVEPNPQGEDTITYFEEKDFEKSFYSQNTNVTLCRAFLENAMYDPISGEIGKSIIFTVNQKHATKITQILNVMADKMFPGKYNSDFAMQVTSIIPTAQQMSINFANNNLSGRGNFISDYRSSKTRVCVTVGMMTTGYDCTDILNIALMRPIFSPSEFIQIKGRGTRRHNFCEQFIDPALKEQTQDQIKTGYILFDFFAVCEYFEEKFDYDQVLALPAFTERTSPPAGGEPPQPQANGAEIHTPDPLAKIERKVIGAEGMKIDRMFFQKFEEKIKHDPVIQQGVDDGKWDFVLDYINQTLINKPEDYFTLEKLRHSLQLDRRITLREIVEKAFGLIPGFKSKDELLNTEFDRFISIYKPSTTDNIPALKYYFKAYVTDNRLRDIIDHKDYAELNTYPRFGMKDFKAVKDSWRVAIPQYIKDYVVLNKFM